MVAEVRNSRKVITDAFGMVSSICFSFAMIYFALGNPLSMYMTPEAMGRKLTEVEMQELQASLGLDGNRLYILIP